MATRFVIDLGKIEMSRDAKQQIEKNIQKAALNALAEIDFQGDLVARFPRDWYGGIIVLADQIREIEEINKAAQEFAVRG